MQLTKTQREALDYMHRHNGIEYSDSDDRTMAALQRRGLVEYANRVGRKYSRSHWRLTTAGHEEANARRRRIDEHDLADAMCSGYGA